MKLGKKFYKQIFESDVMAEFLSAQDIKSDLIAEAVIKAPVSIYKKRILLEALVGFNRTERIAEFLNVFNNAVRATHINTAELLLLIKVFD